MKIITTASAGTMESSDIIVRIEPAEKPGIEIHLTTSVMQQFGRQIEEAPASCSSLADRSKKRSAAPWEIWASRMRV